MKVLAGLEHGEHVVAIERLVARHRATDQPAELAYTLSDLADALWARAEGLDRWHAHAAAEEAMAHFARAGMSEPRARDWLAQHPLPPV